MKKPSLGIFIGIILLMGCSKARNIIVDEVINERVTNRLNDLKLIDNNDTILGIWYAISKHPNSKSEHYTLFTYNKLVQYYQSEDIEPKTINIPLNKILDIRIISNNKIPNRLSIKVKSLRGLIYNERKQKDEIFDEEFNFFPPYDTEIAKQEQFFELLLETWRNNANHNELVKIYSKFYDKEGDRLISYEIEKARNELMLLQKELEDLPINNIYRDDFIVAYFDNTMFLFRYDYINEKYIVFNILTENIIDSDMNAMTILSIYPLHKHGELKLPFTDRDFTVISANRYDEKSIKKILDNHFNKE